MFFMFLKMSQYLTANLMPSLEPPGSMSLLSASNHIQIYISISISSLSRLEPSGQVLSIIVGCWGPPHYFPFVDPLIPLLLRSFLLCVPFSFSSLLFINF